MNQKRVWQESTNTTSKGKVVYDSDINRAYDNLAAAIIKQAIKDGAPKEFFTSDYYHLLTNNMPGLQNGAAVYEQIQKNRSRGSADGLISIYDD